MIERKFGIHFYGWYDESKWGEFPRYRSPLAGEYESDDPVILAWQLDQIKRCGFDYVVFEFLPLDDWSARRTLSTIRQAIPMLQERNLSWSFLLDADLFADRENALEPLVKMIHHIEAQGWQKGLTEGPEGKPMLLVFKPLPEIARKLLERCGDRYELYFMIQFRHWDVPEKDMLVEADLPFLADLYAEGRSVESELLPRRFIGFWQPPGTVKNYHGICPVVPSYDDLLLERVPQITPTVPREEGMTYFQQFIDAVASEARHIIVYGWNEYFEESTLEPATGYGDYYCDLTRDFIRQAKLDEPLCFFSRRDKAETRVEIQGTVRKYASDPVPWEKRNKRFASVIEVVVAGKTGRIHGNGVTLDFSIRNTGSRAWLCKSKGMPIRLGVLILDAGGKTLRELRAADFSIDVQPRETIKGKIEINVSDLGDAVDKMLFNMVYEQRFWFDVASAVNLRSETVRGIQRG